MHLKRKVCGNHEMGTRNNVTSSGHKHTKPPKNCSHKYNFFVIIFLGNVWT